MTHSASRSITTMAFAILAQAVPAPSAHADGGTVRYSGQLDGYQITIMTAPVPPRVGPVDISVLIQDLSNKPLVEIPVQLRAYPKEKPQVLQGIATIQASRNKLFQTVELDLPTPGTWSMEVLIQGRADPIRIELDVEVGEAIPAWVELGLWISWPFAAVALFGFHLILTHRRQSLAMKGQHITQVGK